MSELPLYRGLDVLGAAELESVRASWLQQGLAVAATAVSIVMLGPYFAWTSPLPFRASIAVFAMLFVLAANAGDIRLSRANVALAAVVALLMTYFAAHRRGGIYDPSTGWLAIVLFVLLPNRVKGTTYRCFAWVFALSLVPAIVVWVLSVAGVEVPWSYLYAKRLDADYLLGGGGSYYRQYFGSVVRGNGLWTFANGSTVFRLHGLYEEPGVVGTVAGLLLVAGGLRFKGRPENVILLLGGLMSFSLAFFAIVYASLLWRKPMFTIAATVLLVALATTLDLSSKVPLLRLVLFDRLAFSQGSIAGDNRVTPLFSALYEEFWRADLYTKLFGSSQDISTVVDTGAFSYKVLIYQYGLVGFVGLLTALSVALLAISRESQSLVLLGVLLLSIYQRPNVLSLPFMIILLGGGAHLEYSRRRQWFAASAPPEAGSPVTT